MTTLRHILENLPTLAAETFLTADAPNPTNRAPKTSHSPAGSRPPTNVDVLDALRVQDPDRYGHSHLWHLAQCSRITLEAIDQAGEPLDALPPLPSPTTWAGECDWLLRTYDTWQACCDDVDLDWIDDTLHGIWRDLCRLNRQPKPLRVACTRVLSMQRCGGRIVGRDEDNRDTDDLARSRWCYCADCGQTYTYDAEIRRLGQLQRLPLSAWADEYGIPLRTLQQRVLRANLRPDATDRNKRKLYDRESISKIMREAA